MKLKILKVKVGDFEGDGGELITYRWVKAMRLADEVTIEFGTRKTTHVEGSEVDLDIEKTEKPGGKGFKYRENLSQEGPEGNDGD